MVVPDFLYNVLQIVYHVRVVALPGLRSCRDSTLQSQANREEPLDDMVMEVWVRSRSVSTSSSRIRRCEVANCQASAAWSANAAIISSCSSGESPWTP